MIQIYHNPRCSTSRKTLQLLEETGEDVQIIKYLESPPSKETLRELVTQLGITPIELVRTKESLWKERYAHKKLPPSSILDILSRNPILIERPIVVKNGKAALGRPPEKVEEIL